MYKCLMEVMHRLWQEAGNPTARPYLKTWCVLRLLAHAGTGGTTRQVNSSLFFVLPAVEKPTTTRVDAGIRLKVHLTRHDMISNQDWTEEEAFKLPERHHESSKVWMRP